MCTCTQHAGIFLGLDPLCCTCRWRVLCLPTMFSGLLCHTSQPRACWQTEVVFKTGAHTYCLFSDVAFLPLKRVTISGGFRPFQEVSACLCIGMGLLWLTDHAKKTNTLTSASPSALYEVILMLEVCCPLRFSFDKKLGLKKYLNQHSYY